MRFFISYSRHDFPFVKALYSELQAKGTSPWLDLVDIPIGADWSEEISQAIDNTDVFLLIASPWSINSKVAQKEWLRAYQQKKRILLLVIQSIPTDIFLDAVNSISAPDFRHEDIISHLQWVDLRTHPQDAAVLVQKWLEGSIKSESGPLPGPPERKVLFADKIPPQARLAVNTQFYGGMIGIVLLVLSISDTIYQLFNETSLSSLSDPFQITLMSYARVFEFGNLLLGSFLIFLFAYHHMYGAWLTYQRLSIKTTDRMQAISLFTLVPFLIQVVLSRISLSSLNHPFVASNFLAWGLGALAFIFFINSLLLSKNKVFLQWQPGYDGTPVYNRHLMTLTQRLREERYPFTQIKIREKPEQVCLLYARKDAPFARYLKKSLAKGNYRVNDFLAEENPSSVLLCVLSPFFTQEDCKIDFLRQGLLAGMPVLPVLLQDTIPPQEIVNLNWIDAQVNFKLATRQILNVLNGSSIRLQSVDKISSPERFTSGNIPLPNRAMPFLMSLIALCFLSSMTSIVSKLYLHNGDFSLQEATPWLLNAVAMAIFLFLFEFSARRRISYNIVISIIAPLTVLSLPYQFRTWQIFAQILFLPDIQTFVTFYILIWGCLLFSSARTWLPGGWYIKPGGMAPMEYILIGVMVLIVLSLPILTGLFLQ